MSDAPARDSPVWCHSRWRALAEAAAVGGEDGVDHIPSFGPVRVDGQHCNLGRISKMELSFLVPDSDSHPFSGCPVVGPAPGSAARWPGARTQQMAPRTRKRKTRATAPPMIPRAQGQACHGRRSAPG